MTTKTLLYLAIVILTNVIGNLCLSLGMRGREGSLLTALLEPWVLAGIMLLIVWTLARMALLSWADLSWVLPTTSIGFVLSAAAGALILGERVSDARWLGAILIAAGAALVTRTPTGTTRP